MSSATRVHIARRLPRRLPRGTRIVRCAVHGHRWDVAPGVRAQLECVRCGLRTEAVAGLGR